jgi:hypothetical protein
MTLTIRSALLVALSMVTLGSAGARLAVEGRPATRPKGI